MKILVTGTTGFIGYHLAKKNLERGDDAVGFDSINDYCDVNLKYARVYELSINEYDIKENKLSKSVTYKKYRFIKVNIEDTKTIISIMDFINKC